MLSVMLFLAQAGTSQGAGRCDSEHIRAWPTALPPASTTWCTLKIVKPQQPSLCRAWIADCSRSPFATMNASPGNINPGGSMISSDSPRIVHSAPDATPHAISADMSHGPPLHLGCRSSQISVAGSPSGFPAIPHCAFPLMMEDVDKPGCHNSQTGLPPDTPAGHHPTQSKSAAECPDVSLPECRNQIRYCTTCSFFLNGDQQLREHLAGKKHLRAQKRGGRRSPPLRAHPTKGVYLRLPIDAAPSAQQLGLPETDSMTWVHIPLFSVGGECLFILTIDAQATWKEVAAHIGEGLSSPPHVVYRAFPPVQARCQTAQDWVASGLLIVASSLG